MTLQVCMKSSYCRLVATRLGSRPAWLRVIPVWPQSDPIWPQFELHLTPMGQTEKQIPTTLDFRRTEASNLRRPPVPGRGRGPPSNVGPYMWTLNCRLLSNGWNGIRGADLGVLSRELLIFEEQMGQHCVPLDPMKTMANGECSQAKVVISCNLISLDLWPKSSGLNPIRAFYNNSLLSWS